MSNNKNYQSVKIGDKKYLNSLLIEKDSNGLPESKPNVHHIWIRDRSGSMSSDIRKVVADLFEKVNKLPVGDIVSLGWFSGKNEFGWDVAGFKITQSDADQKFLKAQLDRNSGTIGLTCYTDILIDAKKNVIEKYNTLIDNFSLMFMSDGYPNVDESRIQAAVSELEPLVSSVLVVGYGNYYNKALLLDMATRLGGSLTHAADISAFSVNLEYFIGDSVNVDKRKIIELPKNIESVFSVNGDQIITYQLDDNKIKYSPAKKGNDYIYFTSESAHGEIVEIVSDNDVTGKVYASLIKGLYAYTYILSTKTKVDDALNVLGRVLGDVNLVKAICNAFTNDEYGKVEAKIRKSMSSPSKRLAEGRDIKFLPDENEFCVIDLIQLVQSEPNTYMLPRHPDWTYNRITGVSETVSDAPKFTANDNVMSPMESFVWNDEMMNISINCQMYGHVKFLNEDYKKFGFAQDYPTWVYRNYTIVKDGFLNVKGMYVQFKDSFADKVKKINPELIKHVSNSDKDPESSVYYLDLSVLPVMNRGMGKNYKSAKKLFESKWNEIKREYYHKVYNTYLTPLKSYTSGSALLTEEQNEFLKSQGISIKGFSPKVEGVATTDYYMAKRFKLAVKSFNSIPSVKDVLEKRSKIVEWNKEKKGKEPKFTPSEALMDIFIKEYEADLETLKQSFPNLDDKFKALMIEDKLVKNKKALYAIRSDIQKGKFAILLGKNWFEEFTSRDQSSLDLTFDGIDLNFSITVDEVKVDF